MDPYRILEIKRGAGPEEVKAAFRRQARRWHPDRNPGDPVAEERFREAAEAYEALSGSGPAAFPGPRPFRTRVGFEPGEMDLESVLGDLFGSRPAPPESFPDLEEEETVRVRIPAGALRAGGEIQIPLRSGRVRINLRPDTRPGSRLRVRGAGASGGDLILLIEAA